jgi:GDP-L-fucose synthase
MPTNTFGPNDNYDLLNGHFFPSLIKKIHQVKINNKKELILWGNGKAKREVVYVDDIADACVHFMKKKNKRNGSKYRNWQRLYNKRICK